MDILYTIDSNFIPQISAGICSICENNPKAELKFHIIGESLSLKDRTNLQNLCNRYHALISFYSVDKIYTVFNGIDTGGWKKIILARLLMGSILPKDIHRVLYLDGDTISLDSLQGLWNTDIGNKCIGGVIEPTIDPRRKAVLGLPDDYGYINSGVLLIDLDKWRKDKIEKRLIQYGAKHASILFAADQDMINVVLRNQIFYLPPCYNFVNTFYIYPYRSIKRMLKTTPYYKKNEYLSYINHPIIVHYLGEDRPWRKGSTHHYKNEYYYYLNKTAYANSEPESGWEAYFYIWRVFNKIISPFPLLRLSIINHLIPLVKKIRKKQRNHK